MGSSTGVEEAAPEVHEFVVRVEGRNRPKPESTIRVVTALEHVHLFDAAPPRRFPGRGGVFVRRVRTTRPA